MIDQAMLTEIQSALVEPRDGGADWPSGLWNRDEVVDALNTRQISLLKDSLCIAKVTNPNLTVVISQHRVDLPSDWVRTLCVVWRGTDGTVRELLRSDSFEADHLIPTWEATNATYPLAYSEYDPLQLQIEIMPAPTVAGVLEVLYIPTGTELTGNGVSFTVPDELVHVVKYGTLADLLSKDGRGRDLGRAKYAEDRYTLGVDMARMILEGIHA